jgi:hypothetical protein
MNYLKANKDLTMNGDRIPSFKKDHIYAVISEGNFNSADIVVFNSNGERHTLGEWFNHFTPVTVEPVFKQK